MSDRKRTANFTKEEMYLLVELITKYKAVVMCKQADKKLWSKKLRIWEQISQDFNAIDGKIFRSATVLRTKFENMKKLRKKKFANQMSRLRGTGSRSSNPSAISILDQSIKDIIKLQVEAVDEIHVSDSISDESVENCMSDSDEQNDLDSLSCTVTISKSNENKCANTLSKKFRDTAEKCNNKVRTTAASEQTALVMDNHPTTSTNYSRNDGIKFGVRRQKRRKCSNFSDLVHAKVDCAFFQKYTLKKEHEQKMKNMAELHKIEMEIATVELAIKKKKLSRMNSF